MIDSEDIWRKLTQRVPHPRKDEIPALRAFLMRQEIAHARALTNRAITEPLDERHAQALEAEIVGLVRTERGITRNTAADWLRLLYEALRDYDTAGGKVLHFTRLAVLAPPDISPFAPAEMEKALRVLPWRAALHRWMATLAQRDPDPLSWQAGLLMSAVLHGALVDVGKLRALIAAKAGHWPVASNLPYLEFSQPYAGLGDFHIQRWFADPLTQLLLLRRPLDALEIAEKQLIKSIQRLLQAHGVKAEKLPKTLKDLVDAAAIEWRTHAARVDIEIVRRRVTAHALHGRSWARIFDLEPQTIGVRIAADRDKAAVDDPGRTAPEWIDDVGAYFPWLGQVLGFEIGDRERLLKAVKSLQAELSKNHAATTYLGWMTFLLEGKSATRDRLQVSTIRNYFETAVPLLAGTLGEEDPKTRDSESLADLYAELMIERDERTSERILAKALREFHYYLCKKHGANPIRSVREVLGDDANLEPVDANVLTVDEYLMARQHLQSQILEGKDADDILVAKIVMSLAFRLGMRRMEIFGLRLCDLPSERDLDLLVRPHAGRRLKTDASRRIIPARFLMSHAERVEIRHWIRRRWQEVGNNGGEAYLFALPAKHQARVSVERTADRIIAALCKTTGSKLTHIHQLRHSFGTWLYLALRAEEYPYVVELFGHHPKTQQFLKRGKRLKRLLIGHQDGTRRGLAFAVSRLMGHSGPLVSFGHYIHCAEFLMAGLVFRQAELVPENALFGVAKLRSRWGKRLLKHGLSFLVTHVRRQRMRLPSTSDFVSPPIKNVSTTSQTDRINKASSQDLPAFWIPIQKIHGLLHLHQTTNKSMADIAALVEIDRRTAGQLIHNAETLGKHLGLAPEGLRPVFCPPFPRYESEKIWFGALEAKLIRSARAIDETLSGLLIHLRKKNRQKYDVVFKGEKETADFRCYLRFLKLLEIEGKGLQVLLRTSNSQDVPDWARGMMAPFSGHQVRLIAPPVASRAKSYRPWVGLHLLDQNGKVRALSTESAFFLSALNLLQRLGDDALASVVPAPNGINHIHFTPEASGQSGSPF